MWWKAAEARWRIGLTRSLSPRHRGVLQSAVIGALGGAGGYSADAVAGQAFVARQAGVARVWRDRRLLWNLVEGGRCFSKL